MSGFNDLVNPEFGKLIGTDYKFIDADTIQNPDGDNFRLVGVNAPETYKEVDPYQEVGAAMTQEQVIKLANDMGFTNVIETQDRTGQSVDQFNRKFVDLLDKDGRSFYRTLAQQDITDIHGDYDPGNVLLESREFAAALKTGQDYAETEWDQARKMIETSIREEQRYANQFKQAQDFSGQIGYLDTQIAEAEEAGDIQTANILKQRPNQFNEFASASLKHNDRDQVTAHSLNPFSTVWNTGWLGVGQSMYGVANLLGEKLGAEGLSEFGEAGVYGIEKEIAGKGKILLDYKDVDGFWSGVEYITNNAAISVPYMAITAGATALAPVTGGASLIAPASIYTGQTWNEMEGEKSASIAIGSGVMQAALDRLGIGAIFKAGRAPKSLFNDAVNKLVADRGITKDVAQAIVSQATRKELAGFAGDVATVARRQLAAKEIFKNLTARAAVGGSTEAVTEGLQEATAYLGATLGSDKVFDFEELNERIIAGAVAGGTLGTGFTAPGAIYDTGAWADVAFRQAPADRKRLSQSGKYAQEEVERDGRVKSVQELAAETRARTSVSSPNVTLEERAQADKERKGKRSFADAFTETILKAPSLWRGATRFIFSPELQSRSRSARILADMFGGNLQRVFSGSNYENTKHHKVATYKNMLSIPEKIYSVFSGGKKLGFKGRGRVSDEIYTKLQNAIDPNTRKFDPNLIPDTDPHKQTLVGLAQELQRLSDKMYGDQKQFNPDLGYIDNYLLRYKSLSKKSISKDRQTFEKLLRDHYGFSESDAKQLTDQILDNPEVNDIDEAFDVTRGGIVPGSHRQRSLNLSENEAFREFLERDIFANVSNAAKSAARYTAHREFIGQNGEVVAKLLDDMQAEGVPTEEVNKVASQIQDYLNAESGNYKRPTSEAGKAAFKVQKNFMLLTTLAGLPLATISSFVEFALSSRGLTSDQIFGPKGSLATSGRELGKTLWDGAGRVASVATGKQRGLDESEGQERLRDLGYYEWDVGAATVTGVTETNPLQQGIYNWFFTWTGLQGWTNYTRAIRASIASDYILDKLDTISQARLSAEPKTNEVQEAEEALRNIGINVDDMINAYRGGFEFDPAAVDTLEQNMREGIFNFVNDAVALPQAANRPLIYQDPRFALFTQFQGFIATFTANHIPKLWGEYVKRGSPAMKYNAFALMTTMIMLGFASQYLKDLIKYGGKSPYLDDAEYLQRGIRASGLLGTGERVLDQFFPLYEQRSDNPGEWVWNTTTGESPAISNLKRVGRATGKGLEGDVGEAARQLAKSAPVIGPLNRVTDLVGQAASNWNFKGN